MKTPALRLKNRNTARTVLFKDFNNEGDSENEEIDITHDQSVDIDHHGRSLPRSDSPYNSSRSPSNSLEQSSPSNLDTLWEGNENDNELNVLIWTSGDIW